VIPIFSLAKAKEENVKGNTAIRIAAGIRKIDIKKPSLMAV
jgi:hypothetical protein